MNALPTIALSIRQPWAWLIVNGYKTIENRDWDTKRRGPILIHAAKGMTHDDYEACKIYVAASISSALTDLIPDSRDLNRGGIVGSALLEAVHRPRDVKTMPSRLADWFTGFYGFQLEEAQLLPFTPCPGRLGFFKIQDDVMAQLQHELRVHDRARKSVQSAESVV